MNQGLLQKLLDSYVEKFELFHNPDRHEIYKWTAVSTFQEYWDADADDFGRMFKKALSDSENLIDDDFMTPARGIEYLCESGEKAASAVRDAFSALTAPDHSDYAARSKKIAAFVNSINTLLDKSDSRDWKFRQTFRSAVMYLSMIDPDDNYMYREDEAKAFAEYVKLEEDLGSGNNFDLVRYYAMCDQVAEALQDQQDLTDRIHVELEREAETAGNRKIPDIDSENHILTYDIISNAYRYDLYGDLQARKRRKTSAAAQKDAEKDKKALELKRERARTQGKIDMITGKLGHIEFPDLVGQKVTHRKFGNGTVTAEDDKHLTVAFETGERKFKLPDALAKGFIQLENREMGDAFREISDYNEELVKLQRDIRMLDLQIQSL